MICWYWGSFFQYRGWINRPIPKSSLSAYCRRVSLSLFAGLAAPFAAPSRAMAKINSAPTARVPTHFLIIVIMAGIVLTFVKLWPEDISDADILDADAVNPDEEMCIFKFDFATTLPPLPEYSCRAPLSGGEEPPRTAGPSRSRARCPARSPIIHRSSLVARPRPATTHWRRIARRRPRMEIPCRATLS